MVYANGTRCISAASDHTLRVWDLENHECVYVLKGHTDWVIDIDVFKKGEDFFAISASYDCTLKIWNLSHGSCVGSSLVGHNAGVKTVMVYDHGSKAISGSYDHTLQIWDLNSRKAIGSPLIGHTEWVRDLDVYFSDKKGFMFIGSIRRNLYFMGSFNRFFDPQFFQRLSLNNYCYSFS